ncbi:MAG TPA: ABC transporter ATP-binding protein [Candidatus Nanoarchaeia archaeon]|nr:ABC transporter ATP-binding protein [Candidatus Nanoarchaeia archaeon]
MKTEITVKNLNKSFGRLKIIKDISFNVKRGEFVSVIGPSGCGKTTLLHLIHGFTERTEGKISVNGTICFVFQDHNLFPWMNVSENIAVGPLNQGKSITEVAKITRTILKEVGLSPFKNFYPNQISEGMKQRVGIARALANKPEILLMDEPFGSLDCLTKLRMQDLLMKLKKELNLTILLVTHDIDEALRLSDRVIVLSERPAKIIRIMERNEFNREKILRLLT